MLCRDYFTQSSHEEDTVMIVTDEETEAAQQCKSSLPKVTGAKFELN